MDLHFPMPAHDATELTKVKAAANRVRVLARDLRADPDGDGDGFLTDLWRREQDHLFFGLALETPRLGCLLHAEMHFLDDHGAPSPCQDAFARAPETLSTLERLSRDDQGRVVDDVLDRAVEDSLVFSQDRRFTKREPVLDALEQLYRRLRRFATPLAGALNEGRCVPPGGSRGTQYCNRLLRRGESGPR